jgi:hypothetical protein
LFPILCSTLSAPIHLITPLLSAFFLFKNKRCCDTDALVLSADQVEPAKVQMNKCIRKNLHVFLGDIIGIFSSSTCPDCTCIAIPLFKNIIDGLSGGLFDAFLKPYFASAHRPIRKLDTFTINAGISIVNFQISECEPGEYCSVTPSIKIHTEGEPLARRDDDKANIGGCCRQLACSISSATNGEARPSELARLRQQNYTNRDAKAAECAEFVASGMDRSIFPTLAKVHGIQNLTHKQLLALTRTAAKRIGIPLDQNAKRHKIRALGWLNKLFDAINRILPQFFFEDDSERVVGPMPSNPTRTRRPIPIARPTRSCASMTSSRPKKWVLR